MNNLLVRMRGITKLFGVVAALDGVDFDVWPGEVHILAGENGAGKSTLIKILAGVCDEFEGSVTTGGGVAVIYQELSLVPSMSVADNLLLGRWPRRVAEARRLLAMVGLDAAALDREAGELPIGAQQLVEIAKALGRNARIIVMDEPTSALSVTEVETLFALIAGLKAQGCGIVYITHKMDEIYRIGDRISVLRDGKLVGSKLATELPAGQLIEWMVGREISQQFPAREPSPGPERLRLQNVNGVSLTVRAGEIVGIAGLQGSGASELLHTLFGAASATGEIILDGQSLRVRSPQDAIASGLALVTNDRKTTGLVMPLSITANTVMAAMRGGWRNPRRERERAAEATGALRLRAASLEMEAGELSGGNQQKVVLAKWMLTTPRVLLLDEPTRGIDVGAKREIYDWILDCSRRGVSILLISTELPELLALSDRILALHRGRVMHVFERREATPERVMAAAMGHPV